jgi:hypothetical protein
LHLPEADLIHFFIKKVAARPPKIHFNPQNPHNPGPHPSTRGVAEHIQMDSLTHRRMATPNNPYTSHPKKIAGATRHRTPAKTVVTGQVGCPEKAKKGIK